MPQIERAEREREIQVFALTAFSECETALANSPDAGADRMNRAHILALLGIGYALVDLADQLVAEEAEDDAGG